MFRKIIISVLLVASFLCLDASSARAAGRPSWVGKSEKALNAQRSNDTYRFKVLRAEDPSQNQLYADRFFPLLEFLADEYGSDISTMIVDNITKPGELPTYNITFHTADGLSAIAARLVDEYEDIDYNISAQPVFVLYQLFAVGDKDTEVAFDNYSQREISRPLAGVLSIIPGVGQLYKGNTGKGLALLGSGLVAAGGAVASQIQSVNWQNQADKATEFKDSWENKSIAMKKQRNVLFGAIGCLSAFSIFDAVLGDDVPGIVVNKTDGSTLSVAPSTQSAGLALVFNF